MYEHGLSAAGTFYSLQIGKCSFNLEWGGGALIWRSADSLIFSKVGRMGVGVKQKAWENTTTGFKTQKTLRSSEKRSIQLLGKRIELDYESNVAMNE